MVPEISIIIVNYNTVKLTSDCIRSILDNVESNYEIIVVDNASDDNSATILAHRFPDIIMVESDINLGFGRANNLGAKYARGKYLFLLNSDTILHNDPFPYFLKFSEHYNDIGALGTYLFDGSGDYCQSGGKFYSVSKYLKLALLRLIGKHSKAEVPLNSNNIEVPYVIGADMFIRKDLFNSIGGFDDNIFMYFEDVELCKRLFGLGYRSYLVNGPAITHLVKSSSTSQFSRLHNTASLMYCIRKDEGVLKFRFFQIAFFLLKFPILIVQPTNLKNNCEYLSSIFNYKKYLVKK